MSAYTSFSNELATHSIDVDASELHGLMVGYLCAVKDKSEPQQRSALYAQWTGGATPESLQTMLEAAFAHTLDNLGAYSDFEFALLIPDDDNPIDQRVKCVSLWCSGFLSGSGD